ncbi:MAG: hypothetical protein QM489_04130 [Candidatus Izemoplasma sp.]
MKKQRKFLLEKMIEKQDQIFDIVIASDTELIPSKGISTFSQYYMLVEDETMTMYYIKTTGLINKKYDITEEITVKYDDIQIAEFGKQNSFLYLQLTVNNELNAFVCNNLFNIDLLVKKLKAKIELIDYKLYEDLVKRSK